MKMFLRLKSLALVLLCWGLLICFSLFFHPDLSIQLLDPPLCPILYLISMADLPHPLTNEEGVREIREKETEMHTKPPEWTGRR